MPVYGWATRWFLERGYSVVLPLRRGFGETGGKMDEQASCATMDFDRVGLEIASDIQATIEFVTKTYPIDKDHVVAVGHSAGGWGALALASLNPNGLRGVVSFAGGISCHRQMRADPARRHLFDASWNKLAAVAGRFGAQARVPSLWIYAENDSFIDRDGVVGVHRSFSGGGTMADLRFVPAFGSEGHSLFLQPAGVPAWSPLLQEFLSTIAARKTAATKR